MTSTVSENIGGIDLGIRAGDGSGTSGTFNSPVSLFLPSQPGEWFIGPAGEAFYSRSITPSFVNISANTLTPFGTINLDTTGLAVGTYNVVLFDAFAVNQGNVPINTSSTNTQFNIVNSSVPEPGSLVLMGIGTVALIGFRARKRIKTLT